MTTEERAEKMCQLIWLDVSEPMLPLKDRYRAMKDRIVYELNVARAEGAEQTVQKILGASRFVPIGQCTDGFAEDNEYVVPASVLAPKEEK